MAGIKFNTIKTRVRIFFLLNIALVIGIYITTIVYNNEAESDIRLVEVSKANESSLERMSYLTKSIVEGTEEELRPVLLTNFKNEINNFETNLKALREGGEAVVNNGKEIIPVSAVDGNGKEGLENLEYNWNDLSDQLNVILTKPILKDTVITRIIEEGEGEEEDNAPLEEDFFLSPIDSLVTDSTAQGAEEDSSVFFPSIDPVEVQPAGQVFETVGNLQVLNPEVGSAYFLAQTAFEQARNTNQQLSQILEENLDSSQIFFRYLLLITFLINLLILIGGLFYIGNNLVNPLKNISATAKDVASGDIHTQMDYRRKDEIGEVANSLNLIVDSFKQYTEFAENIGKGNFAPNFDVKSDQDVLGYTLLSMRDNLKQVAEEDKKRNWANEGFALFSDILRSTDKEIEEFAYDIISNLVKYVNANQGGLFLLTEKDGESFLEMQAAFAYNKRKYEEKKVRVGQGLLGQVVLEKEIIYLDRAPEDYIRITSGLGNANPRGILITPLKVNEEVYGAIEIAAFRKFEKYEVDFIERLSENIASTISSVKINENTKMLLDETRQYAEQMQAQEEEMRQNMEELAATQEEMEKNQRKLEEYKENLEIEVEKRTAQLKEKEIALSNTLSQLSGIIDSAKSGIIALNMDYQVVAANERSREILRQLNQINFEIGDYWFDIYDTQEEKAYYKQMWDKAFEGLYYSTEESFILDSGKRRWFDISFSPIRDEDNFIMGASLFMRDITERKRNQKDIELTAHILDNSTNEVYVFNASTFKFTYVNEKAQKNLGYTIDDLREKTPYELTSRFNFESFEEYISPLKDGHVDYLLIDAQFIRNDTSVYDIELNLQYFEDEDRPLFAAIAQDITERKKHEQELEEALERFNLATSATKEGIWEMHVNPADPVNPDNPAWWSKTFKGLLGFKEDEFGINLNSWSARLHPDDREKTLRALYDHLIDSHDTTPYEVEYRLLTKKNEYQWFAAAGQTVRDLDGTPKKFAGSIRNIHRRKRAERDLAEQTAIVKGVLNAAVNAIISVNVHGIIMSVNRATEKIFAYRSDELIGKELQALLAQDEQLDLETTIDIVKESYAIRKDGQAFPVDVSVARSTLHNEDRRIYVVIFRDTTERKEKEQNLSASEERLRRLANATSEGIFFHENWVITDVNQAFCQITGFSSQELMGKNFTSFLTKKTQKEAQAQQEKGNEKPYEVEFIRKDENNILLELQAHTLDQNGNTNQVVSAHDITEQRQSEQEQRRLIDILDTLPDCICYTDATGIIKYVNQEGVKLLGYASREELVNQSISVIYPSEVINKFIQEWLPASIDQGVVHANSTIKTKDGSPLEVQQSVVSHLNKYGDLEYVSFKITQPTNGQSSGKSKA